MNYVVCFLLIATLSFSSFSASKHTPKAPHHPSSAKSVSVVTKKAEAHLARGNHFFEKKNYKLALQEFNYALTLDHNMLNARRGLAKTYANMGKYQLAEAQCDAVLKVKPNDAFSLHLKALAIKKIAKYQKSAAKKKVAPSAGWQEEETPASPSVHPSNASPSAPSTSTVFYNETASPRSVVHVSSPEATGVSSVEAGNHYRADISLAGSIATDPARTIYYIDGIFPLYYSSKGDELLFFSPKQNWYEPYSTETNMGLGFRKIMDDKYILGMHLFSDSSVSPNKISHSQYGIGAEYLSEPFDVRANYYHPSDSAEIVDSSYEFGSKNIVLAKNMEEAMEGYDLEVGGPIYPLNAYNTKTYLGAFSYKSTIADDLNGVRFRTESKLNDFLSMDLSVNSGKGSSGFSGGLRAVFPLDLDKIFAFKDPMRLPSEKLPYLKDRMFERVVRDLDIRVVTPSDPILVPVEGRLGELIYVKNDASATGANGTYEHPWKTLLDAFIDPRYVGRGGAAKTIYVFRGNGTMLGYQGTFTLSNESTLWGSGYNGGYNGLPVSGQPFISGEGIAAISLGNNNIVQGLNISSSEGYGIYADDVTGGIIRHNTINGNGSGGISINGDSGTISNFNISNNIISGNTGDGIDILNTGASMSDFNISGNTISSSGYIGMFITVYKSSLLNTSIAGNTIEANANDGIRILSHSNTGPTPAIPTVSDLSISNNTISSNLGCGVDLYNDSGNMKGVSIEGNKVETNSVGGIVVSNTKYSVMTSLEGLSISGNTISSNTGEGIYLLNSSTMEMFNAVIADNTIEANEFDGIHIINSGTMDGFTISGNTLNENSYNGIFAYNKGTMSNFEISGNTMDRNAYRGINIYNYNLGTAADFTISGNTVSSNTEEGVYFKNIGYLYNSIVSNNTIEANSADGIYIDNNNGTISTLEISANKIMSNNGNGLHIRNTGGTSSGFDISGNTVSSNTGEGIYLVNGDTGAVNSFNFTGNVVANNTGSGMDIKNDSFGTMSDFGFTGNTIEANSISGITINNGATMSDFGFTENAIETNSSGGITINNGSSISTFEISENIISSNTGEGISISDSGVSLFLNSGISNNTIESNSKAGISIINTAGTIDAFEISGNTVSHNAYSGIVADNDQTISNFDVIGNTVSSNEWGVYLNNNGYSIMSDVLIDENTIEANSRNGIRVDNHFADQIDDLMISRNIILSNHDDGIFINNGHLFGVINNISIEGNTLNSNANGININNIQLGSIGNFTVSGNTISSNHDEGLYIISAGYLNDSNISNNTIEANTAGGVYMENGYTISTLAMSDNDISSNGGIGFDIDNYSATGNPTMEGIIISNNTISSNTGEGIYIRSNAGGSFYGYLDSFDISGNAVSSNKGDGIYLANVGFTSGITFEGNTISSNTGEGININNVTSIVNSNIEGNTIEANSQGGVYIANAGGTISTLAISDNNISSNTNEGIEIYNNGTANGISFEGNTFSSNFGMGIYLLNEGTMNSSTFMGNTVSSNTGEGILIYNYDTMNGATFESNVVANNDGSGLALNGTITNLNLGKNVSSGHNSIYGNGDDVTTFDILNNSGATVSAEYNWWGTATPQSSQFGGANSVDHANPLSSDPNAP